MQIEINLLNELYDFCMEGVSLDAFTSIMNKIDARTSIILQELNFNPNDLPHVQLFQKNEAERTSDIQKVSKMAADAPEVTIPYAINAICRDISKTVRRELLAFATDFSGGLVLRFRISFATFATAWSSIRPETEKAKVCKRLQEMKDEGFELVKYRRKENAIADCDKNRTLLKAYCQKLFGVEPWSIKSHNGIIMEMELSVPYHRYKVQKEQEEPTKEPSATLTADNVVRLSKLVSDAKFAISSYKMMEDSGCGNLVLASLRSYVCEMESITNAHGRIWTTMEEERRDIRTQNQKIREMESSVEEKALPDIVPNLRTMMSELEEHVSALVAPMGYYVDSFVFHEYNQALLSLSPNPMQYSEPSVKLDGVYLDDDHSFYAFNTPGNLEKILEKVHDGLPSAAMETFEVRFYKNFMFISEMKLRITNPLDMQVLRQIPLPTKEVVME